MFKVVLLQEKNSVNWMRDISSLSVLLKIVYLQQVNAQTYKKTTFEQLICMESVLYCLVHSYRNKLHATLNDIAEINYPKGHIRGW